MFDYYYTMPNLISSEERAELLRLATKNDFIPLVKMTEFFLGEVLEEAKKLPNNYFGSLEIAPMFNTEEQLILDIVKRYSYFEPMGICFLHVPPNKIVEKHTDVEKFRRNALSIPLSNDFSGTYFYEDMEAEEPICYCAYTEPTLLNILKPHSITNNEKDRYVFQIVFNESYENIRDFYEKSA